MAWRTEQNDEDFDIVIDGFEKGIADSPELGIADMRSANIISNPNEAAVNFALKSVTLPPVVSAVAFTCTASDNRISVSSTSGYYEGMAIIINTLSGGTGLSATSGSNTFYVTNISGNTFQVSVGIVYVSVVNITLDGSGTLSTAQFGTPGDSVVSGNATSVFVTSGELNQWSLILDTSGQLWLLASGLNGTTLNTLHFCGNTNHSSVNTGIGIAVFFNYVFLFLGTSIDYIPLATLFGTTGPNGNWVIAWQSISSSSFGHKALAATDNALYFCNDQTIGSILQNPGSTFNPATASTYTFNTEALTLPDFDYAKCLAQLGTTLLVGGALNYVYPWDRISTSFNYPLVVAETKIQRIVSTNSNAYVFAGNRGRIYITNGANIELFKKFPDHLSGVMNPYYTWGDALYYRNQLYFSLSVKQNDGTTINDLAGVWAINLDSPTVSAGYPSGYYALRMENTLGTASYSGTVPVICPMGNVSPKGNGLYVAYLQTTGKIDYSDSDPYTGGETRIDTDLIPIGTYYNKKTFGQVEFKLSKALVSGESVQILWRGNLTDSFTSIFTYSTAGDISGASQVNFEKNQWIQLRVISTSTATTPSFVRLRELRIR